MCRGVSFPRVPPTGSCRPSVCPVTSMPATLPHPGPTCTAWSPAAPGTTSCLCLSETDAGPCLLSEWGCGSRGAGRPTWLATSSWPLTWLPAAAWMWLPCGRLPSTSWGHTTSAPSSQPAAPLPAPCAHCVEPPCPWTPPVPWSCPRRAGESSLWLSGGHGGCMRPSAFPEGSAEAGCVSTRWGRAGQLVAPPRPGTRPRLLSLRAPSPAKLTAQGGSWQLLTRPCWGSTRHWFLPSLAVGSTAPSTVPRAPGHTAAADF